LFTAIVSLYLSAHGRFYLTKYGCTPFPAEPGQEQLAFADPSTPTVFDIFEELGLKLDLQKALIDTIFLISVQRPSEN